MTSGRTPSRRDRTGGFLLAETLATFALSALVLVALSSSAVVLFHAVDASTGRVASVDDLGRTLDALRRDIGSLSRQRWAGIEPRPFVFRGGPNSLFFAHREPDGRGGAAMDVVALREVSTGSGTVFQRSEAPLPVDATGFAALRFGRARALPTGAVRLRFSYLAAEADGRASRPLRDWPAGSLIPLAVLVEAIVPSTGQVVANERIAIHADGDIGCAREAKPAAVSAMPAAPGSGAGQPVFGQGFGQSAALTAAGPAGGAAALPIGSGPPGTAQQSASDEPFCGRVDREAGASPTAPLGAAKPGPAAGGAGVAPSAPGVQP